MCLEHSCLEKFCDIEGSVGVCHCVISDLSFLLKRKDKFNEKLLLKLNFQFHAVGLDVYCLLFGKYKRLAQNPNLEKIHFPQNLESSMIIVT